MAQAVCERRCEKCAMEHMHTVKSVTQQLARGPPGALPALLVFDHIESEFSTSAMVLLDYAGLGLSNCVLLLAFCRSLYNCWPRRPMHCA